MIEQTISMQVFITTDGTHFYENQYGSPEEAKKAAERYDSLFANPKFVIFNHGFNKGDTLYYSSGRNKIYLSEVIKVERTLKSEWVEYNPNIDPYYNRDKWHFDEPAWIDKITINLLAIDEEVEVYGDFIKVKLKKTVEEFVA
jgi:hypothetical protein